jgi:hypothetical protein
MAARVNFTIKLTLAATDPMSGFFFGGFSTIGGTNWRYERPAPKHSTMAAGGGGDIVANNRTEAASSGSN